jgi:hypothetical protein
MMGDEMLTPRICFFFGDRSAERKDDVRDWLWPSFALFKFRLFGLDFSFLSCSFPL